MKRFLHRLFGDRGERAAVRYLKKQGYRILARQHRSTFGEIDVIARDGKQIVFVEVKTRRTSAAGQPFEAVDRRKQQQLTRLALAWLKKHGQMDQTARFDVVSVLWPDESRQPEIRLFRHAFDATGHNRFFG